MEVEYYATIPHRYYLTHFGIKERSGRYPWGSGERPYQRLETPEEKRKRLDENRDRVMKSGTASEVKEYIPEMSAQEIQNAVNRINWTNQLNSLSEKEYKSAFTKIDKSMEKVGKVNNWIGTGFKTYRNAVAFYKIAKTVLKYIPK